MKRSFWLGTGLFSCMLMTGATASAQNTSWHGLTVKRWTGSVPVSLTQAQVDSCMNLASTIFATDSDGASPGDAFCNVNLTRSGSLGTFTATDGHLDTGSEVDQVANFTPGFLKVVKTITYCGKKIGSFAGCTQLWSLNHVVLSETAINGGVCGKYIAHEFGHAVGMADDASGSGFNVMRQGAFANYNYVTPAQCGLFRTDFVDHDGPGGSAAALRAFAADTSAPVQKSVSLLELASRGLGSRVPAEVIGRYGHSDVRQLLKRLPGARHERAGIFQLIGLVGGEPAKSTRTLKAFIETASDDLDSLSSAVISLGYLASYGSEEALDFLFELSDGPRAELASWAVSALGVSGAPDALEHLNALLAETSVLETGAITRELIEEAIEANEIVRDNGLKAYYAN